MMRNILIAAVLLLASCRKEHVCECRTMRNGAPETGQTADGRYVLSLSRSSAENTCIALEKRGEDAEGTYVRNCELTN